MKSNSIVFIWLLLIPGFHIVAQKKGSTVSSAIEASIFKELKLRNIGPSHTGGRVVDIAIDPKNRSIWFAAVACGNVWRTKNAGTTWEPVFEKYGSYSTGIIVIDPQNSNVIWLGTGENNGQRSVGKGDGVYKSMDGGNTWKNVGLKTSEHIGKIIIDPRNSEVVYVASQGPLWSAGGERGLYKTKDGGETWERILHVSDDTGISDIIMDIKNPNILLASSYQRRRHTARIVAGGPEGGIWKSTDAGKNWKKLKKGLPEGDVGRIGLGISPQKSNVVYATIYGNKDSKGLYRSVDQGEKWVKMSDYVSGDSQYYMEIFTDPHQFDKIYCVDFQIKVSEDGGKTFETLKPKGVHVDHHEIEFDPTNENHLIIGNDGGIYETWDQGVTWRLFDNMQITQFYRVGIDNDYPFYNLYGGTQDNNTFGGPSASIDRQGISTDQWQKILGGDGFQTRVDPTDPNIVYSQAQHGWLVRYDKKSGERISIKPSEGLDDEPYKWHWNSPLIVSAHQPKRLYFAANKLFKSEDRGNSWTTISEDLSLQMDRNKMEVMGRIWGIDAISKNSSSSRLGSIVALDESPLVEGLLYAGTDDGQISITEDGGKTWTKSAKIPDVPDYTYVSDLHASWLDQNVVYAIFNNHKRGDYKPYIFKSTDKGKSWKNIAGDLPQEDFLWSVVQDHINPNLLFLGSEYGLYFSLDQGEQWIKLKGGMPTTAIRDLEIQRRDNDLIAASFGRGFFILDDYSPLRYVNKDSLDKETYLFPISKALSYIQSSTRTGYAGDDVLFSPNPEFGALITYYVKESVETLRQQRQKEEKEKVKAGSPVYYPDWDDLLNERMEKKPQMVFRIYDKKGKEVNRVSGPLGKGLHRISWNLRDKNGFLVPEGTYEAQMYKVVNAQWIDVGQVERIEVIKLKNTTFPEKDFQANQEFKERVVVLQNAVNKSYQVFDRLKKELKKVISDAPLLTLLSPDTYQQLIAAERKLYDFGLIIEGDKLKMEKSELASTSLRSRIGSVKWNLTAITSDPTKTMKDDYSLSLRQYRNLAKDYNQWVDEVVSPLKMEVQKANVMVELTTEKLTMQ